ncbi:MAG: DUF1905 domain-containing protein [Flavobacteriales bacterium]
MWEFETKIEDFGKSNNLWGGHIVVDDDIVQEAKSKNIKRFLCTINNQETLRCALLSMGNGTYFVMVNAEIRKKLHLTFGSVLKIKLEEDKSKYGIPMPEEMEEIMAQDPEVDKVFHSLTPGKQRCLLYLIGKPKTTESRIKKAVLITRYLAEVNGEIDFKEMNEYIKTNNKLF